MNDISQQLGTQIKKIRTSLGMSQEALAFKADISAAHLGQIERGVKSPTITTIAKIAKALNVTLPILFSFDITNTPNTNGKLNKIDAYLSNLTDDELNEILKIIKSIVNLKSK